MKFKPERIDVIDVVFYGIMGLIGLSAAVEQDYGGAQLCALILCLCGAFCSYCRVKEEKGASLS